jgi:hypothetical protein
MAAMLEAFFHSIGRFLMKPQLTVSTRQVLNDFAVACLLALAIGASVGLAAAGFVALVSAVA